MYRFHVKLTELGTNCELGDRVTLKSSYTRKIVSACFPSYFFHQIFFRLTGIQDRLKSLDEFEIGQDQTF